MGKSRKESIEYTAGYVADLVGIDPKIARNHIRTILGGTLKEVGKYKNGSRYDFGTEEEARKMAQKIKYRLSTK